MIPESTLGRTEILPGTLGITDSLEVSASYLPISSFHTQAAGSLKIPSTFQISECQKRRDLWGEGKTPPGKGTYILSKGGDYGVFPFLASWGESSNGSNDKQFSMLKFLYPGPLLSNQNPRLCFLNTQNSAFRVAI